MSTTHRWTCISVCFFHKPSINSAVTWTAINVDMKSELMNAFIVVHDLSGREVTKLPVLFKAGQLVLDTRMFAVGTYTIDMVNGGTRIATEKLVVQQ